MYIVFWRWLARDGGFVVMMNPPDGVVTGHFFHSKEQARELFGKPVMYAEELPGTLEVIEGSDYPKTSLIPMVTIEMEHAMLIQHMVTAQLTLFSNDMGVVMPEQWWVCFVTVPLVAGSHAGMIGYFDEEQEGHIQFFFSRAEARRLLALQKSYTTEMISETVRNIEKRSFLPEESPKPTVELKGPIATLICGMQAALRGEPGVQVIRKGVADT